MNMSQSADSIAVNTIKVALSYAAQSGKQYYTELSLPKGASIYDALIACEWLQDEALAKFWAWVQDNQHTQPNHKAWYVGIFSQKKPLNTILNDEDRVEIYRALHIDPMGKRKLLSKNIKSSSVHQK